MPRHEETGGPGPTFGPYQAPSSDRIDRELVVPASPEELWEVVVSDGWLAEEVHFDLRPGGEAAFLGPDAIRTGWVEEAQSPDSERRAGRLVFWWGEEGEPASRVELALEPEGQRQTRLRITETRPLEILDLTGVPLPGRPGTDQGPVLLALA